MGRVLTNLTSFAWALESTRGVLPASPVWKKIEPNKINSWGAQIKTVSRTPIRKNRQNLKGTVTDLDEVVSFDADATLDSLTDFFPGFVFAKPHGGTVWHPSQLIATGKKIMVVNDPMTYARAGSLVFLRGFANASNNGLKSIASKTAAVAASKVFTVAVGNAADNDTVRVGSVYYKFNTVVVAGAGTSGSPYSILIGADDIATGTNFYKALTATGVSGTTYSAGLVANADVTAVDHGDGTVTVTAAVAGVSGNSIVLAKSGTNISWAGGATALSGGADAFLVTNETLVDETPADSLNATAELAGVVSAAGDFQINSSGDLISSDIDFTTLGLTVGQGVFIGNEAGDSFSFANAANSGFARIKSIAAGTLSLDKKEAVYVTDNGSGKTPYLLFGRFIRNVAVDDADYEEYLFQFEATFPGLADDNSTEYEYAVGNECNTIDLNLPLTNKATATFAFVGQDVEPFTESQKTNASSPRKVTSSEALNTSSDVARLRVTQVDESGLMTDFKSLKVTLNNNASAEKTLAKLGAKYINVGIFTVTLDAQVVFTSPDVITAIRNNTTVSMDFALRNHDGGVYLDIPSLVLGGGTFDFVQNASVLLSATGTAFEDATLDTSLSLSVFPYLPAFTA